jgi:hypothetical protein
MKPRPFSSRLRAMGRVGASFFARIAAERTEASAPCGLVDRLEDLGRPGLLLDRIDPAVLPFLLDPASLEIRIESTWHGGFAVAWRLLRPLFGFIGQLYLPLRDAVVHARTVALDPGRDGRSDVRGVIREYTTGDRAVMQVMAYATWRENDRGYMSAAFPFPPGALCGVLRMDLLETAAATRCGIRLTTARDVREEHEPVGVWFALGPRGDVRVALPLEETLDLSPVAQAPRELRDAARAGEDLVGVHVQKLFGARVVTHRYWFRARAGLRAR